MNGWKLVKEGEDWVEGGIYVYERHGDRDETCVYSSFVALVEKGDVKDSNYFRRLWLQPSQSEGHKLTISLPRKVDGDCILIGTFQDAAIAIDGLIRRMFADNMPEKFKRDDIK